MSNAADLMLKERVATQGARPLRSLDEYALELRQIVFQHPEAYPKLAAFLRVGHQEKDSLLVGQNSSTES